MTLLEASHAASVALGIAGAACVAWGRTLLGQALWVPANVLWIAWCAAHGDAWGGVLFGFYLGLACTGVARELRERRRKGGA